MRVFISWSKGRSHSIAKALHTWIEDVLQAAKPWVSSEEIRAGARWSNQVAAELAESKVGVLVVTPENQKEPWLLFEAGALAKQFDVALVCPYLVRMEPEDLEPGPLTQFMAKRSTKEGTLELLRTINSQLTEPLTEERLERLFNGAWPQLAKVLHDLPEVPDTPPPRRTDEMLAEILETVRALSRDPNELWLGNVMLRNDEHARYAKKRLAFDVLENAGISSSDTILRHVQNARAEESKRKEEK